MNTKHPGFKAVQRRIAAKLGISAKRAGAIIWLLRQEKPVKKPGNGIQD